MNQSKTNLKSDVSEAWNSLKGHCTQIDEFTWATWMHLSLLAGFIMPFLGLIAPIVMWQLRKNESYIINNHGKNIVNWLITMTIASIVIFALTTYHYAFGSLSILLITHLIFPIIGAIKADKKQDEWAYPLSLNIFKTIQLDVD
jgi:uncharacterized Tic20 family protein